MQTQCSETQLKYSQRTASPQLSYTGMKRNRKKKKRETKFWQEYSKKPSHYSLVHC